MGASSTFTACEGPKSFRLRLFWTYLCNMFNCVLIIRIKFASSMLWLSCDIFWWNENKYFIECKHIILPTLNPSAPNTCSLPKHIFTMNGLPPHFLSWYFLNYSILVLRTVIIFFTVNLQLLHFLIKILNTRRYNCIFSKLHYDLLYFYCKLHHYTVKS